MDTTLQISPKIRTAAYLICTVTNALAVLVLGLAAMFGLVESETAAKALGLIAAFIATIAGALGVAYRPTKDNESQ